MPGPAPVPYTYPAPGPFYVSPAHGSDISGDGSSGNPWATIPHARDFIRNNNLNKVLLADLQVIILDDVNLSSPISFGINDSGSNGFKVRYIGNGSPGSVSINGGTAVTGWTLYSGSIFRAPVTGNFWTVYENGIRARCARNPSYSSDGTHPCAWAPYFNAASNADTTCRIVQYKPGDLTPDAYSTSDLQVSIWSGGHIDWWTDNVPVTSIDTVGKLFNINHNLKFKAFVTSGSRYFVQNVLDVLDSPGEWYYDRNDVHGSPGGGQHYLYYIARDGAIGSQNIVIPTVTELIQVTGNSNSSRVHDVSFEGFNFKYTDFVGPWYRQGYSSDNPDNPVPQPHIIDAAYDYFTDLSVNRLGMVHLKHCDTVTVKNCKFSSAGMHAIYGEGYVQNCTLDTFETTGTGLNGIKLQGEYPGEGDFLKLNNITNFKINNFGELGGGSNGLELAQSGSNTISFWEITDGPRRAFWIVCDDAMPANYIYGGGNNIHHGKIARVCQDSGDVGALTVSHLSNSASPPYISNTFNQIIIDSITAHASMTDVSPVGVFNDNTSYGQVYSNIEVTNTQGAQMRNNSSGNHTLTNTSFQSDGTNNPGFDSSQMDTANIGVKAGFPF